MPEQNDSERGDLARLDRLVREALSQEQAATDWPPDNVVSAYIAGNADDEQTEQVHAAMESSPQFARMMLDAIDDYAEWSEIPARSRSSLVERIAGTAWYVKIAPLAAAAVIALVLIALPDAPRSDWRLADSRISTSVLGADQVRRGMKSSNVFATARGAALAALPEAFTLNESFDLVLNDDIPGVPGSETAARFDFQLVAAGQTINCTSSFVGYNSNELSSVQLWVVSLLDQSLRALDGLDRGQQVQWDLSWGTAGACVATARVDSGYVAGSVALFSFESARSR